MIYNKKLISILFWLIISLMILPCASESKTKKTRSKNTKKSKKENYSIKNMISKGMIFELSDQEKTLLKLNLVNIPAARLAMKDLEKKYPKKYKDKNYIKKLDSYTRSHDKIKKALGAGDKRAIKKTNEIIE